MAQRSSRKRRKQRQREARGGSPDRPAKGRRLEEGPHEGDSDAMARGYARGRKRDEAARAALAPLAEGERPPAVTAGALVAAGLALAQVVAFGIGYEPGENGKVLQSVLGVGLLGAMAWGMWRVRYWAVLGMQTLLGITILVASVAAIFAANLNAVILVTAIIVPAGALFWFLVKSMARIQMPERPGSR